MARRRRGGSRATGHHVHVNVHIGHKGASGGRRRGRKRGGGRRKR